MFGSTSPVWLVVVPQIDAHRCCWPLGGCCRALPFGAAANSGEPTRDIANVRERARIRFIVGSVWVFWAISSRPPGSPEGLRYILKPGLLPPPVQIYPQGPHLSVKL